MAKLRDSEVKNDLVILGDVTAKGKAISMEGHRHTPEEITGLADYIRTNAPSGGGNTSGNTGGTVTLPENINAKTLDGKGINDLVVVRHQEDEAGYTRVYNNIVNYSSANSNGYTFGLTMPVSSGFSYAFIYIRFNIVLNGHHIVINIKPNDYNAPVVLVDDLADIATEIKYSYDTDTFKLQINSVSGFDKGININMETCTRVPGEPFKRITKGITDRILYKRLTTYDVKYSTIYLQGKEMKLYDATGLTFRKSTGESGFYTSPSNTNAFAQPVFKDGYVVISSNLGADIYDIKTNKCYTIGGGVQDLKVISVYNNQNTGDQWLRFTQNAPFEGKQIFYIGEKIHDSLVSHKFAGNYFLGSGWRDAGSFTSAESTPLINEILSKISTFVSGNSEITINGRSYNLTDNIEIPSTVNCKINGVAFNGRDDITIPGSTNATTLDGLSSSQFIKATDVMAGTGKIPRFDAQGFLVYPDGSKERIENV